MTGTRGAGGAWRAVILVALALVSTGAVACRSRETRPRVAGRAALDSADQLMFGARFTLTDNGVLRANLVADTALFFDDNTRVELLDVNTTFFTATGMKNAVLTARRGTYRTNTGEMTARGNVVVNSEDGRRLRTEQLTYAQARNEISSDSAFLLTEPQRRLQGIGFRSDPNLQNIRVLNTISGSTGTVTIPSQ